MSKKIGYLNGSAVPLFYSYIIIGYITYIMYSVLWVVCTASMLQASCNTWTVSIQRLSPCIIDEVVIINQLCVDDSGCLHRKQAVTSVSVYSKPGYCCICFCLISRNHMTVDC